MELKTYFAQDASGNIMPGATVTVYEAGTATLATGLQDEAGSPLANPFTADSSAKVAFYAPDGLYDITVVGNGRTVTIRAQFVSVDGASVLRADLAATGGSALVGSQEPGGTTVKLPLSLKVEGVSVRPEDFGGVLDGVADDSIALQKSVDWAASYGYGATIDLLDKNLRFTQKITIPNSYIKIRGKNSVGANAAGSRRGSGLLWDSAAGGNAIEIKRGSGGGIYAVHFESLSIKATSAAAANKADALMVFDSSECVFQDVYIANNWRNGLIINGSSITRWVGGAIVGTENGIVIDANGTSAFATGAAMWVREVNFFNNSNAAVKIAGNSDKISFVNCWAEYSPVFLLLEQQTGRKLIVEGVTLDDIYHYNGTTSPYKATRLVKVVAQPVADNELTLEHLLVKNSKFWSYNDNTATPTHALEFQRNGNTNAATRVRGVAVEDSIFYGLNAASGAAVAKSDFTGVNGEFRGRIVAKTGYQTGADVSLSSGVGVLQRDFESGTWTPVLLDSTLNPSLGQTASVAVGEWYKVKDRVHFKGRLRMSSLGTLNTSAGVSIGGLPFTSSAAVNSLSPVVIGFANNLNLAAAGSLTGYVGENGTRLSLQKFSATTGTQSVAVSEVSLDGELVFSGWYSI